MVSLRFTPRLWWFGYFAVHTGAVVVWLLYCLQWGCDGLVTLRFTPGLWWFGYFTGHTGAMGFGYFTVHIAVAVVWLHYGSQWGMMIWLLYGSHCGYDDLVTSRFIPGL